MRLYAQGPHPRGPPGASHTHGDTVRPVAATGLAQEAGNLALCKAFAQACPTLRAAGPVGWVLAPFSQHSFDEVDGEHAGHLPRCPGLTRSGGGVFDGAQETLHSGVIVV